MTLSDAKDQIAKNHGKTSWNDWAQAYAELYGKAMPEAIQDEAAELYNASLSDSLSYAINQLKMVRHIALQIGNENLLAQCNAALDSPLITKYDKV